MHEATRTVTIIKPDGVLLCIYILHIFYMGSGLFYGL